MKVNLIGVDGKLHTSGEVDGRVILTAQTVIRNGRLYMIARNLCSRDQVTYVETATPYHLLEF